MASKAAAVGARKPAAPGKVGAIPSAKVAELAAENARLARRLELLESKQLDGKADGSLPEEPGGAAEADGKRITQLRKDIAQLEGMEGVDDALDRNKKQSQELLEARRSTKSLDEQIEGLEGFIERRKKALLKQEELVVSNVAQAEVYKEAADAAQKEADRIKAHIAELERQRKDLHGKKVPGAVPAAAAAAATNDGQRTAALQELLRPKAAELGAEVAAACQALGALCPAAEATPPPSEHQQPPSGAALADVPMDGSMDAGGSKREMEGLLAALVKHGMSAEAAAAAAVDAAAVFEENKRRRTG